MTITAESPAAPRPTGPELAEPDRRRWLILAVLGFAQLMVVLDATIVNIALPTAQHALGFSDANRQWVVTGYALAFGSLLLLGGRIADVFGRKFVFIAGLIGFAVASAIGGAAPSFEVLVIARALQGAFGALLAPAALSLLTTTFTDPAERNKAFGIFGAIAGGGGAIGLLLGGLLTEHLSWRWTLYVNLPIAVIAAVGGAMLLTHHRAAHRPRLDIPGVITVSAALFSIVYGFANAESKGWDSPLTWGFLATGVVLIGVFGWLQTWVAHPLLPLRVLLDRNRGGAFAALFIVGAGMFAIFLFLTYYLQQTLGYTPVKTGLAFLPMLATLMTAATTSTAFLLMRIGPKPLITTGLTVAALAMAWFTRLDLDSTYAAHVLPPLLLLGAGLGLVVAPGMNTAVSGVAAEDSGVASAVVNTTQQIGGSIGTAVLSTIAANAATDYLAGKQPTPDLLAQAALQTYITAFWWAAGIFAVGAVITGLLLRRGVPSLDPAAGPVIGH